MHLAILDWGIGGLPTLAALQDARPTWSTTYISDAGFTPYGKVPADGLAARLGTLAKHAADAGADALIVACNAMSTVLDDSTPSRTAGDVALALPVFGIIGPGGSLARVSSRCSTPSPSSSTAALTTSWQCRLRTPT